MTTSHLHYAAQQHPLTPGWGRVPSLPGVTFKNCSFPSRTNFSSKGHAMPSRLWRQGLAVYPWPRTHSVGTPTVPRPALDPRKVHLPLPLRTKGMGHHARLTTSSLSEQPLSLWPELASCLECLPCRIYAALISLLKMCSFSGSSGTLMRASGVLMTFAYPSGRDARLELTGLV